MFMLQHLQIKQPRENKRDEQNDDYRGNIYPPLDQPGFFGDVLEYKIGGHVLDQFARQASCILSGTLKTRDICDVCLAI